MALGYGITLFALFSFFLRFLYFVRASTTMCTRHTRARSRRPQEAIPGGAQKASRRWQLSPWVTELHFLRFFCFFLFFFILCARARQCVLATLGRDPGAPRRRSRWRLEGVLEGDNCGPGIRNHAFCVLFSFLRKRGNV